MFTRIFASLLPASQGIHAQHNTVNAKLQLLTQLTGTLRLLGAILTAGTAATQAALGELPSVRPLPQGQWRTGPGSAFAQDVKVVGRYAYVADYHAGLQVIDVSNPSELVRVGGYDPDDPGVPAFGVAVSGKHAFLAEGPAGFEAIDISDPAHCVRVGGYSIRDGIAGDWVRNLAVSGTYAYVAANSGLLIFDVSDPTHCMRVGSLKMRDRAWGVAVSGKYAYVAGGDWGMEVIDVSDPTHCVRVGEFATGDSIFGVAVSGNYAYAAVADDNRGLQVIDVRDPAHPRRAGGCVTGEDAFSVALWGNYAYVATSRAGLRVIDVSDPTNCIPVGEYDRSGEVAVVDGRIYVAAKDAGLLVLPTLKDLQFTVRVNAHTNETFTLESATDLSAPMLWTKILTTNVPVMPFDYVDFDVKLSEKPTKFYRLR